VQSGTLIGAVLGCMGPERFTVFGPELRKRIQNYEHKD
jgi:hypothetical protein